VRYLGHGSGILETAGRRVVIIGGGDNAFSAAVEAATAEAKSVVVLCRSADRAQHAIRAYASALPNIEVRVGHEVEQVEGQALRVRRPDGPTYDLEFDVCYATLGFVPNTELWRGWTPGMELDAAGYIRADQDCKTSVPRLWAAGDICNPVHPCVATAVALGTMAARDIEKTLREDRGAIPWTLRR
jgi:thioredoxin reductase (NADPH)